MADPRTVKMRHPDKGTEKVTPEVAVVLERQGWERVGGPVSDVDRAVERATAPLKARIVELEEQLAAAQADTSSAMPENADERIRWIGNDPDRAAQALDDETSRGDKARKSVTAHIEAVLNPTTTDQAGQPGQEG